MSFYLIKIFVTTGLIVVISEIAKRSSLIGAILASIPLVSVLAMIWLYIETKDVEKISILSINIFWLALPSLALFISLPLILKQGLNFYIGLSISVGLTAFLYILLVFALKHLDVRL